MMPSSMPRGASRTRPLTIWPLDALKPQKCRITHSGFSATTKGAHGQPLSSASPSSHVRAAAAVVYGSGRGPPPPSGASPSAHVRAAAAAVRRVRPSPHSARRPRPRPRCGRCRPLHGIVARGHRRVARVAHVLLRAASAAVRVGRGGARSRRRAAQEGPPPSGASPYMPTSARLPQPGGTRGRREAARPTSL